MSINKDDLDKIYIRDLLLRCIIGINEEERSKKQDVIFNITIYTNLKKPCHSDRIEDSIDYKVIKKEIIELVENSSYLLIEKLAEKISEICLNHDKIVMVDVVLDKPGALRFCKSVAVEITREKKE